MARKHRRRGRRYGGITSVSLGAITDIFSASVGVQDVLVGVAAGFIGANLVQIGAKKVIPLETYAKLQSTVGPLMPVLSAAGAAAALYMLQKNSAPRRAEGHAAGALAAGVTLAVAAYLKGKTVGGITFDEVTSVNLGGGYGGGYGYRGYNYGGLLVGDTTDGLSGYGGLLVGDTTDGSMAGLAMSAMGDDDDGLGALMSM